MPNTFGYPDKVWNAAKAEAKAAIVVCAKLNVPISYSDLVSKITTIDLQARDPRLNGLLEELSTEEDEAGRGLLTAFVVKKDQDPGAGFYALAERLGYTVKDRTAFWIEQMNVAHAAWRDV